MRDKPTTSSSSENLAKTGYTALIISGLITFLAMFFPLQQSQTVDGRQMVIGEMLPWLLAYGIPCLLVAAYGVFGLTSIKSNPFVKKSAGIIIIVGGALTAGAAIPIGIFFQAWEFFVSVLAIGGCIIAIGILALKAEKNGE